MLRRPGANRRGLRGFGAAASAWTPASDAGAKRWWRADLGRTMVSTKVSAWQDQIEGVSMSQGTDAKRPTTGSSIGGQSTLQFAGAQHLKGSGFASVAQRWLVYVVAEVTGSATNQIVIDDGGGTGNSPVLQWNSPTWRVFAGTQLDTGDTTRTGASAWLVDANGASSKVYRDDFVTALVTGNAGASATDSLTAGATDTDAAWLTGAIAEIVLTTTADPALYRSYFNARYGMSIT